MSYRSPQTLVYQVVSGGPTAVIRQSKAHIAGGHAYLLRYDETDEKALGALGYYDATQDTAYSWPSRPTGALIDESYTKVYIDNALLRYFSDAASSGTVFTTIIGSRNKITSPTFNFITNGTSYPRNASLYDRDVATGDVVRVRGEVDGTPFDLWSYVKRIIADEAAAVIGSATDDANNQTDIGAASASASQTAGASNCVSIDSTSAASYDGLADGDVTETYTVEVIQSSTSGDPTTALLRVTSASGRDNVSSVTPSAFGVATNIGTRGLTATFDVASSAACSASADVDEVTDYDLIAGQTWEITAQQAFTGPTATSGGTYTGTASTTYIIEVTEGGIWANSPKVSVTTTDGVDSSAPQIVAEATAVPVGNYGATISFAGDALCTGDIYYITVTPASDGPYRTIELGNNIPDGLVPTSAEEVSIDLYIRSNIEVPENNPVVTGTTHWDQSATEITINQDIYTYESTWTDSGVQLPLPVEGSSAAEAGMVYVEYRAWRSEYTTDVYEIHDVGDLDDMIEGALDEDNPLKWGVYNALRMNADVGVLYTAVADPDTSSSWTTVLDLLSEREDVYNMVPLTKDTTVMGLYYAAANSMSTPENNRWRVCWFVGDSPAEVAVVDATTSTDSGTVLAILSDDPDTSGTQYTYLTVPADNAQFVTNGVVPGDTVRFLYTTDAYGETTYTEFTVDAVINESTIRLASGHTAAVSVARKMEVWHTQTLNEEVDYIKQTGGYSTKLVRWIWPDVATIGGVVYEGTALAATLAGLSCGVVPQQGLSRYAISGFTAVPRTTRFSRAQLDELAEAGVWIVTQDPDGTVYTRHALTTAASGTTVLDEESLVRNTDSVSYFFKALLEPYIGKTNLTESNTNLIKAAIRSGVAELKGRYYSPTLGGQISDGGNETFIIRPHATLEDTLIITINIELPRPLNNIECSLTI